MSPDEKTSQDFLLAELREGQERAFDYIFRKYYKALCAQANAYIHDLDKAQSLVQDCFVRLWVNRTNLKEISSLSFYLSSMVRNRCTDYLRKSKSLNQLHETAGKDGENNHTEELLLSREFEEKLIIVLSSLPERSRMAFEYSRFEGLSYPEIAQKMGITVKAVEALVSRALKILRKELSDYLPIILLLYKLTRF